MRELIAGFILLGLASGPATGQAKDQSDVTRSIIQAERRSIVAATMQLDDGQAALFWPLYDAYRDEVGLERADIQAARRLRRGLPDSQR